MASGTCRRRSHSDSVVVYRTKDNGLIMKTDENEKQTSRVSGPVQCLCLDVGACGSRVQFAVLTATVFVLFVLYGYLQEWIFRLEGMKAFSWYLALVQFAFYSVFAKAEMIVRRETRHIPMRTYYLLAFITLITMGFSISSLAYLSYPTQVIFKCCKLIPVLIGGILIQGKSYGPLDFFAAFVMCIGLAWFVLAESTLDMNFDATGVAMLSVALAADAALGNVQEKAMKQHHAANAEVICYSYTFGFVYLALAMALSGTLLPSATYFAAMPAQKYGSAFVFSLSGYFGMQVVLSMVRRFGAFTTVTVTSFRKALTIVVSFLAFSKPFSIQYVFSGLLVLIGVYLNLLSKRHRSFDWKRLAGDLVYLMKWLVNKQPRKSLSPCKTAVC